MAAMRTTTEPDVDSADNENDTELVSTLNAESEDHDEDDDVDGMHFLWTMTWRGLNVDVILNEFESGDIVGVNQISRG